MKPVFYTLLMLCCALCQSSCETKDRFAEAAFQYRVDSTVNARLDQLQNQLQKRNDSMILDAAQKRAAGERKARLASPPVPTAPVPLPAPPDSTKEAPSMLP